MDFRMKIQEAIKNDITEKSSVSAAAPSAVAGIIMECNPFHDGHRYILQEARRITNARAVIAVISGDFAQRGIPTVFSKEERTRSILEAGADLVLELPVCCAVSGAEYFARGGVQILARTHVVTDLVFGSESGDSAALLRQADFLLHEPEDFKDLLHRYTAQGLTFPQARTRAARECSAHLLLSDTANDVLGTEYVRNLLAAGRGGKPLFRFHPVRRITTKSATTLRQEMQESHPDSGIFADDFSGLLLGKLLSIDADPDRTFSDYADISADLSNRIHRLLPSYLSWTQFCGLLKTRNLTYTGISRALTHILLDMTADYLDLCRPSCVRVLGCRREALPLLGEIQKNFAKCAPCEDPLRGDGLFLITGKKDADRLALLPGSAPARKSLALDLHASLTYDLVRRRKRALIGNSGIQKDTASADFGEAVPSEFSRPFLKI